MIKGKRNALTRTGPLRVHELANGDLQVVADVTPPGYTGAFAVRSAGAMSVRVGYGLVQGLVPRIDGVPIDGKLGKETVTVPELELSEGPNDDLRSWVCLRFRVDLETGLPDPADEETASIVHVRELSEVFANGVSPDDGEGHGHCPLAMVVWSSESAVQRIVQDVYFNQRHAFVEADAGRRAFHVFSPSV